MKALTPPSPATALTHIRALNALPVVEPEDVPYWEKMYAWSKLAAGAYAAKTADAFRSDWPKFVAFCVRWGRKPLPAAPDTVRLYILSSIRYLERDVLDADVRASIQLIEDELAEAGIDRSPTPCKITTLERWLSSISAAHRAAEVMNPRESQAVQLALKKAKRVSDGSPKQKDPLRREHLKRIIALPCRSLRDEQDVLLALVIYQTGARSAAIVRIGVNDLHWEGRCAFIEIWREKTDQDNKGRLRKLSLGTSERLRAWLSKNGIVKGPVFRGVLGKAKLLDAPLTTLSVRAAMKRVMAKIGEPWHNITAHSVRIGGAQDLRAQNKSMADIMAYGPWKNATMPARYTAKLDAADEGIVDLAKDL